MNIQQATIKNFMGIELVEITSDGTAVQIAGRNDQGKTSAMLAIIGALGGKKEFAKALGLSADPGDDEIIRRGEEMAEVVVEFGGWVVTWQRERGKSDKVEIRGSDGGAHGRAKLGELIGAVAFDPLAIDSMPPAERRATLLEMAGIDLEEIDGRRDAAYNRRRFVNRDHKQALARVGDAIDGAPEEVVDIAALDRSLGEALDQREDNRARRQESGSLDRQAADAQSRADSVATEIAKISALEKRAESLHLAELENMKRRHADEVANLGRQYKEELDHRATIILDARKNHKKLIADYVEQAAAAKTALEAAAKLTDPPLDPIKKGIEAAREANELYRLAQERIMRHVEAEKLGHKSRKLTISLAKIDDEKVALLADAEMPIEGLGVSDDDVMIDGHLWATANFSRRLKVCVAIAAEMAGELKIAFLRSGGNDLDEENYAALIAECEKWGLQPWIERNNPEGAGAIVIKQGLVAS